MTSSMETGAVRLPDVSSTIWKDMLLNLLVVLLLAVGEPAAPPHARAGAAGESSETQIHVRIDAAGHLSLQLENTHERVERANLAARLRALVEESSGQKPSRLVIHHEDRTPAGAVYAVLEAADGLFEEAPLMSLDRGVPPGGE